MKEVGSCKLANESNEKKKSWIVSLKESGICPWVEKQVPWDNTFGHNKEIYHLGNKNPAIPFDLMETGLLLNKVFQRAKNRHKAGLHKHRMLTGWQEIISEY